MVLNAASAAGDELIRQSRVVREVERQGSTELRARRSDTVVAVVLPDQRARGRLENVRVAGSRRATVALRAVESDAASATSAILAARRALAASARVAGAARRAPAASVGAAGAALARAR